MEKVGNACAVIKKKIPIVRFPLFHSGGCYGCWQEGSFNTVFFV